MGTRIARRVYIGFLAAAGLTVFLMLFALPMLMFFDVSPGVVDYLFATPLIVFIAMLLELILFDH
jgi:hypothetical protein